MKKQGKSSLIATECFTRSCSQILSRVNVASADKAQQVDNAIALWDTGATQCFISQSLVEILKLKKIGETDVRYANGKVEKKDIFSIRLTFQPSCREIQVYAAQSDDKSQDIIIGMNVIRNGKFLLEPTDEGVRFTFTL